MKPKTILLFLLSISLISCSKYYPIRGTYPDPPFKITVDMPFEKTWSKVVDIFAERGISIKLIDKSSGIIVSAPTRLSTTYELKKGGLKDPDAFIVVPVIYDPNAGKRGTYYQTDSYRGEVTVRIKDETSKCTVIVNIGDVTGQKIMKGKPENGTVTTFKSTGKFEDAFFELLRQ